MTAKTAWLSFLFLSFPSTSFSSSFFWKHSCIFATMKYAQLVMGPAGSGKSTYCKSIQDHCENRHRTVHIVNLDPAAEYFAYTPSISEPSISLSFSGFLSLLPRGTEDLGGL